MLMVVSIQRYVSFMDSLLSIVVNPSPALRLLGHVIRSCTCCSLTQTTSWSCVLVIVESKLVCFFGALFFSYKNVYVR